MAKPSSVLREVRSFCQTWQDVPSEEARLEVLSQAKWQLSAPHWQWLLQNHPVSLPSLLNQLDQVSSASEARRLAWSLETI